MPRATLKDVALKAGVSRTTVSLILNGREVRVSDETRLKVLQVAEELQYTPNALIRSLQTQSTSTIGLYIGVGNNELGAYVGKLFGAIRSAAGHNDYDILMYRVGKSMEPIDVSKFLDGRVDGLIYWGGLQEVSYQDMARAGLPVVVLLEDPDNAQLPSVFFDDASGMVQSLQHLQGLGHRNIAYVAGRSSVPHLKYRQGLFKETVQTHFKDVFDIQIWDLPLKQIGILETHLSDPEKRPTALICAYDELADACLQTVKSIGLQVPEQLSIISWEDLQLSGNVSEKTSVWHDIPLLGEEAVKLLLRLIEDDQDQISGSKVVLPVKFHTRSTTGPAPVTTV